MWITLPDGDWFNLDHAMIIKAGPDADKSHLLLEAGVRGVKETKILCSLATADYPSDEAARAAFDARLTKFVQALRDKSGFLDLRSEAKDADQDEAPVVIESFWK